MSCYEYCFLFHTQDWLKRKDEKLQETFRAKKQEEKLKEKKKAEVKLEAHGLKCLSDL